MMSTDYIPLTTYIMPFHLIVPVLTGDCQHNYMYAWFFFFMHVRAQVTVI